MSLPDECSLRKELQAERLRYFANKAILDALKNTGLADDLQAKVDHILLDGKISLITAGEFGSKRFLNLPEPEPLSNSELVQLKMCVKQKLMQAKNNLDRSIGRQILIEYSKILVSKIIL